MQRFVICHGYKKISLYLCRLPASGQNGCMKTSRFVLPEDTHVSLTEGRQWRVVCESGLVWITRANDMKDRVLKAGESADLCGPAIVLGALQESRICLVEAGSGERRAISSWRARAGLLVRRLWLSPSSLALSGNDITAGKTRQH